MSNVKSVQDFLNDLENELAENKKAHAELAREFYSKPRSKEVNITWLMDRCFRELDAIPNFSHTLGVFYHELDRDLVQVLAKQVLDEARHYHLLASVIENMLGRPVTTAEIKPLPATRAQNDTMTKYGNESVVTMFACRGYGAEYLSAAVNWALLECAEPEVQEPYKVIARDEEFHARIGRMGLERYATTPEKQELAWKAATETADLHLKAYTSMFKNLIA